MVKGRAPRAIEGAPRARLVADAQQVHAEIACGARVRRIEVERPFSEGGRLVEPVVACRLLPDDAVDFPVRRIDLEGRRDFARVRGLIVVHECHSCQHRVRVELRGIHGENRVEFPTGVSLPIRIEIQAGEQQVCLGEVRIDRERLLRRCGRLRRILVLQYASDASMRGRPARVRPERRLEGLQRLRGIEFVEEKMSEGCFDDRAVGARPLGVEKKRSRVLREIQGVCRAPRPDQHGRIRRVRPPAHNRGEDGLRVRAAPEDDIQQRELQRRLIHRRSCNDRLEHRPRLCVPAAGGRELGEDHNAIRIGGAASDRHLLSLFAPTVRDGRHRRARKVRPRAGRLRPPGG